MLRTRRRAALIVGGGTEVECVYDTGTPSLGCKLTEFIKAQGEVVRELERQLLSPPAPKQRKSATKH